MKDIEPRVFRQRMLIEAKIGIEVRAETVKEFLNGIADHLDLKVYGEPVVYSTGGLGKEINQGFDGFVPLIDSGISISVWVPVNFIAVLVHTCKKFDPEKAAKFTKEFFKATQIASKEF